MLSKRASTALLQPLAIPVIRSGLTGAVKESMALPTNALVILIVVKEFILNRDHRF